MQVLHDVSLADYSTMRLGGLAAHLAVISDRQELVAAVAWAHQQNLAMIMLGGGSNTIWRDEGYNGLVLINAIGGYTEQPIDSGVEVTIGAGENWDAAVARSVASGLTGIEALSLVPGSSGATPVQNVGAYGQEIAQTLVSLEAYDLLVGEFVTITAADCGFGYRTSRFKQADHGRFFIVSIKLLLHAGQLEPPFYPALQQYLTDNAVTQITPVTIREAVIAIRSAKLPDPALVANNGSFFANPVISQQQLQQIQAASDVAVAHWPAGEGLVKIAAGWLVEQVGMRGIHDVETGMATWPQQALVLVNEHARSTADLLAFKQKIVDAVYERFGITLEQEPELLP